MRVKAGIMDGEQVVRALRRLSHEIMERNDPENLVLVGIRSRGIPISEIIAENIRRAEGREIPVGRIDISLYRDDLAERPSGPVLGGIDIPVPVTGKNVILVDDVLYTGRTARAAIDALFSAGRPRTIQLAVLVDRGHRELPVRPDYVGKNLPTSRSEIVKVSVPPYETETSVKLLCRDEE